MSRREENISGEARSIPRLRKGIILVLISAVTAALPRIEIKSNVGVLCDKSFVLFSFSASDCALE
jgi:hypothetical protein